MGLKDFDLSVRMREAIYKIAAQAIEDVYPLPRYATVTAVDYATATATVQYPDEAGTFVVPISRIAPAVGAVVRIAGRAGKRYVDEIVSGGAYIITGDKAVTTHRVVGASNNVLGFPTPTVVATLSLPKAPLSGAMLKIDTVTRLSNTVVGAAYAITDVVVDGTGLAEQGEMSMSSLLDQQVSQVYLYAAPVGTGSFNVDLRVYKTANVGTCTQIGPTYTTMTITYYR